jgi:hypothetical protein
MSSKKTLKLKVKKGIKSTNSSNYYKSDHHVPLDNANVLKKKVYSYIKLIIKKICNMK